MRQILLFLTVFSLALPAVCQNRDKDKSKTQQVDTLTRAEREARRKAEFEEFKKARVEYISKAMKLTDEEAKIFWPLCFKLWEQKFEADQHFRRQLRAFMKDEREGKAHTEEDYRNFIKIFADKKLREAQLDKEYLQKFLEILPAEKVFLFQGAEQDFVREMLNKRRGKPDEKK